MIRVGMAIIITGTALAIGGCVRRTMTINTAPQGADVTLNDEKIGTSPVSVDFTWYGDYDVIIRREGYETLHTNKRINAPWFQVPPIDFVTEALLPFTLHDRQELTFALETRKPIDREELLKQAGDLRDRTLFEGDATIAGKPAATAPAAP